MTDPGRSIAPAVMALALALPALTPAGLAFHDGGAGRCSGCHVSHVQGDQTLPEPQLLLEGNPTDTCLLCHETGYGNTWGSSLLAPGPFYGGGSFIFLLEDNLNDGPDRNDPAAAIPGHHAGHSVISIARGTLPDPENTTSPGGNYPSAYLHCTSCHDPHGRSGNYRLLYGTGDTSRAQGHDFTFTRPAPRATGLPLSGPPESDTNHPVYLAGISGWCENCHGDYHNSGSAGFEHPGDHAFQTEVSGQYNRYEGTGNETGDGTDSYLALIPYQDSAVSGTSFTGPAGFSSRLTCLSCHRAHASSGPYSGRWDFTIQTWADEGASGSYPIPSPYPAVGPAQGPLCEKCHGDGAP